MAFQRDRERIVHSKAFRRLDEKTQVLIAGSGDHYRTRLTHTIEVSQVSRDIARRLQLNEDLCEAIALAHDLGHPPFGHDGEFALNEVMEGFQMDFEHNKQSQRVVEVLEKVYPDFDGLNLSFEVLGGLIKHQTAWDQAGKPFEVFPHLEAQVVNIADEIAYTNHDVDDGVRSGLIEIKHLRKFELWKLGEEEVAQRYGKIKDEQVLISRVVSAMIGAMVEDLCKVTLANLKHNKIASLEDVKNHKGALVQLSPDMSDKLKKTRMFLHENFYLHPTIGNDKIEGRRMIKKLFEYYHKNPENFPKKQFLKKDSILVVTIKDYIAGMTDRFLINEFKKIFKNNQV